LAAAAMRWTSTLENLPEGVAQSFPGLAWQNGQVRLSGLVGSMEAHYELVRLIRKLTSDQWHRERRLAYGQSFTLQLTRRGRVVDSIGVIPERDEIVFSFTQQPTEMSPWDDWTLSILLEWTPCNDGGLRPWSLCPAEGCGRRAAIVYLGSILACRECCGLGYATQQVPGYYRAQAIRGRLGRSTNLSESLPEKP